MGKIAPVIMWLYYGITVLILATLIELSKSEGRLMS